MVETRLHSVEMGHSHQEVSWHSQRNCSLGLQFSEVDWDVTWGYQRQLPESASLSISQDVYLLWDRVSTMMSSQLLHRIVSVYSPKRCSFFSESTLLSPAPSGSVLTAAKLILELIYSNRNGWLLKRRKWLELIVQNKSPPMPSLLTISVPSLFLSVYSNGTCRLA